MDHILIHPLRRIACKENGEMTSQATQMMPEARTAGYPEEAAGIANPTENEIAAVAFQLWLEGGCPIGSDQEHWFRAQHMLRIAQAAKYAAPACRPSMYLRDIRSESVPMPDFASGLCWGHWSVWERECGGARWVWDVEVVSKRGIVDGSVEKRDSSLAMRASA